MTKIKNHKNSAINTDTSDFQPYLIPIMIAGTKISKIRSNSIIIHTTITRKVSLLIEEIKEDLENNIDSTINKIAPAADPNPTKALVRFKILIVSC